MTRQELIDAVTDHLYSKHPNTYNYSGLRKGVGEVINALNAIFQERHGRDVTELFGDGWIPVTERLPELGVLVLWGSAKDSVEYGDLTRNRGTDKYRVRLWGCELYSIDIFTHWMPLPKPPTE